MLTKTTLTLAAFLLTACMTTPSPTAATDIRDTLLAQATAWNTGDIDAFMSDYVPDKTLRFASGGTVERGFSPTLARYKRRYPDASAMGRLTFSDLEIEVIDQDDALVFGRWELTRDADAPGGLFTLHMVKRDGDWLIQSDHTSSSAP